MAEYIEREAAIERLYATPVKTATEGYCWVLLRDALKAVDEIPATDVRPVVRARAILKSDGRAHCSECDCPVNSHSWHYCPHCGAELEVNDGGGTK